MDEWILGGMLIAQIFSTLALLSIAGNIGFISRRIKQMEITTKELCDRIWDLRK